MSTTSLWDANELERKVIEILGSVEYADPGHHLGRPFLTPYQLAIIVKERYPETFNSYDLPVGGSGSGTQNTFAQYLAGELSRRIQRGEMPEVEGGFLSNLALQRIKFNDDGETVTSSATGSQYDLSLFRLRSHP